MFKPTIQELQPVVAYLEAHEIEISFEDRKSEAVVLSLKMPSGEYRTLTINYKFLQNTSGNQIEDYLNSYNFARDFKHTNQHITTLRS